MPEPISNLIARAVAGHSALAALGGQVEDEWQYVTDLEAVWRGRLEAVRAARGEAVVEDAIVTAVDRALAEIGLITDPHRAIDWLSTFPQIVLLALGEEDRPPAAAAE